MLYSPERISLPGVASHINILIRAGQISGEHHTLYGVKEKNGSSMVRGYKLIGKLSELPLRTLPFILLGCLAVFGSVTAHAQSAKTWDKRGQDAETRQEYDNAFQDYQHAVELKPTDLRYKTHFYRTRFLASAQHVDRGRVLRQQGDLNGALNEYNRALQINPGYETAEQEITQIQKELQAQQQQPNAPVTPGQGEQIPHQNQTISSLGSLSGPIELKPLSNDPIPAIHMVEDVKVIYQAIGKAAGFNVLFDPDYTSKRIPVDLNNVSWSDALRIVGALAGTFYKPVTSNTIFVAQNTQQKRQELDEQAVQTFYLTNASQQNDANEVVVAIRNLLDPSVKIYLVPSQNAIVMRATPDELLFAQKVLNDLDRAKPEVVIDVAVLEVNKDKTRNLGITLPQSMTITPQAAPGSTTTTSTSTSGTTTTTSSNFTLNTLAHLNANNFAVSIPPATVNALLTDVDTRILQNPSIRITDGQHAVLKIGSKIPVATGSYNAGVSTGVASIGVQTQFTYLDIGVNLDITPSVHYDHEVGLKLKIEVLSQTGQVTISGVTEPIIGQRSTEQFIQLEDGEPSLLSGLINAQNLNNVSGTPGLGELPFIKYFFASHSKEVIKDEIVFILVPHIVRESVLTRANLRPIDTGTGRSFELRHDTSTTANDSQPVGPAPRPRPAQPTSAANAAAGMAQQLSEQAAPPKPPTPNESTNPIPSPASQAANPGGQAVNFSVVPSSSNQSVGSTFQVAVMLSNAHDVFSVPLQLKFNPAVLQLVNVDSGEFLSRDNQVVSLSHRDDGNGIVAIATERPPNSQGVSGQGSLCTLTFKAVAAGDSDLSLVKVGAHNSQQANIPAVGSQAVVHVK